MKKVIKEYSNGVTLILRIDRGLIDYFVDKEYKNTVIIEGISQEEFIDSNEVYEKIVGSKCESEVIKVQVIDRREMTDEELYQKLFGINERV